MTGTTWTVYVDDNFHFMDEEERYCLAVFDSYAAAVEACHKIIDASLEGGSAKTADALYESYTDFGADPWIMGPAPPSGVEPFSAREYARRKCHELLP